MTCFFFYLGRIPATKIKSCDSLVMLLCPPPPLSGQPANLGAADRHVAWHGVWATTTSTTTTFSPLAPRIEATEKDFLAVDAR